MFMYMSCQVSVSVFVLPRESLSSIHLGEQRKTVEKIRMVSKQSPENRIFVAEDGSRNTTLGANLVLSRFKHTRVCCDD